jgi:general secretion pathway protein N
MLPRLEPRGWLLVAFAAWALLCAMVALTGFGGHYSLLSANPRQVHRLPTIVQANANPPMGPLGDYAEAANRPLFYPDRKPMAVHLPGQGAPAQPLNAVLTSVIMTPTLQMAIVQDPQTKESLRVREGQALGGAYSSWKLMSLSPREAAFENGAQEQTTLVLRVFDGNGGEEPTRVGLTPQMIAAGAADPQRAPGVPNVNIQPSQPQLSAPPDLSSAAAAQAANSAAEAAQQAEQIRQRIQQRRMQAQAQSDNSESPNDKR